MKRHKYILILFFSMLALATRAQVSVKLQAPRQVEVGRQFRVSYVVNTSDVDDLQVGDFEGFRVLYGPSTSSSSSFSMVNGKTTSSSTVTYTYTVVATEEGKFTLPAASVVVKGKTVQSGTAEIEVLPASDGSASGNAQQQQPSAGGQQGRQQQESSTGNGKDLYITVTANKRKIFEQEAVFLTYKLYTLVNIQQLAGEMPQLDGCHVQEVNAKAQMSLKYERVNGRNYGTAIWRQYVLFPQKTGHLKVPSITFDAQVEVQNTSMDPFDIFFGGGSLSQIVRRSIVTPAIDIEVMPLPTPKPDNFSGAVGQFSLTGSLTPQELEANDAATLRLVISGQGNMKLMKAPQVNFPKDFEVYDPKVDDKTTSTTMGAKGNIIYDYVVVPRHGGKYDIAPVEFSYFDPESSQYKTLKTDPFSIQVAKGKNRSVVASHEQEDLKVLNSDIRYIKMNSLKVSTDASGFFGTAKYWLTYAVLAVLFGLALIVFYRQAKERANLSKLRGKKAGKEASKRLRNASRLMKSRESNDFYEEVMHALLGYAGDKLNLPVTELNKENVSNVLTSRGVDENIVSSYLDVLSECEFARFAQGDSGVTMEKIFEEASDVISKLDAVIRK